MIIPRWVKDLSRADFLKSAGLYVTRERLFLVHMRKALFQVSLVGEESRKIPTLRDEASRRQALANEIRSLLADFDPTKDPIYICMSPDQTLACEVLLPQVAGDNVRQVLEYEIERLLPFRRDELYYDFLPMGKKGERIRLFLFAVPRKVLDEILDVLLTLGVQPAGVETTATALCNYLLFCAREITGPNVVVAGQDGAWEMIGVNVRSGGLMQEAEMLFSHRLPRADWIRGPGRELLHGLLRESPRFFACGSIEELLLSLNGESIEIEDLAGVGKQRLITPTEMVQPASIPAIGVALRGLRETALQVNLHPEPLVEGRGRRVSRVNGVLAVLFLMGLIVWGGSYPIKDEIRLRRLQGEIERLGPSVEVLRIQEEQFNKIHAKVSMLAELRDRKGEILRVLKELTELVPQSAYLSILRYRDGTVELRGSAQNASSLIPLLEDSPLLKNVGFNAPTNRGRDNRETFSLKAEIER